MGHRGGMSTGLTRIRVRRFLPEVIPPFRTLPGKMAAEGEEEYGDTGRLQEEKPEWPPPGACLDLNIIGKAENKKGHAQAEHEASFAALAPDGCDDEAEAHDRPQDNLEGIVIKRCGHAG